MDKILHGIMKYRVSKRAAMVKKFREIRNNPKPKALFFTCMESRMIPTRITEASVGDMFIVRNAGNVVPHSQFFLHKKTSCEPAALELGCVINDIRHIIVCGHSDCKAMHLLYSLKGEEPSLKIRKTSPLKSWIYNHGQSSLKKFLAMKGEFTKPVLFSAAMTEGKFSAYIDPENKFPLVDKLSQINTLQQVQNITSYDMLKKRFEEHNLHIHALWYNIYTGETYYFSRLAEKFILINESSYKAIFAEVGRYY